MISRLKYAVAVLLTLPFLMLSTSCSKSETDQFVDRMEDVCDILADVDDKESADKAADKLKAVFEDMRKCREELYKKQKSGEISETEFQEYVLKTMKQLQAQNVELQKLRSNNCYGSEALQTALLQIPAP